MEELFDKIKDGATKTKDAASRLAKEVAKRTSNAITSTKLSYSINEANNKIKDIYAEIGKSIYEKYLKGEFDEYKKWMSSVYTPLSWNYKDDWYIWQYLNRGELAGYTGGEKYIDLNILNKDKELEDLIIK